MRFHANGPSIPDILLERCDAGRVVFLCGAGVSQPSGMPTFVGLTQHVVEFFDPPADSEIMVAFRPWLGDSSAANVPLDQIFNLLHQEYGRDEVNALVTQRLTVNLTVPEAGREHALIKRISSNQSGKPQIVTTNFDRLFEMGSDESNLVLHEPPAFPNLNFGTTIDGITYLHGRLVDPTSDRHPYVLSSADFGRAYLSEGWATNFVRNLLERYTVVLVGYQAEDPPIKYLLQGLNHDGQYDRSRLYAFDRGIPEEIEAKWRDRGVTAIAYSDHTALWRTIEAWADRADDPRAWRASVIAMGQQDPKELPPHIRGQVAHVLRTVPGAKLFAEANPTPHAEWVCVMDSNVRSANQKYNHRVDVEAFDPKAAYGLDDDLADISEADRRQGIDNENLLVWRDVDDNPTEFHRLGGRQVEGFEATPIRLNHLINWIIKSIYSPVLAWWAIRQNGLHPRLLQQIELQLERSDDLNQRARHVWNLILEHHRDPRNREWDLDWYNFKKRIGTEGWTASTLREFRRVSTPRIKIKPPYGLGNVQPPSKLWEMIRLSDLGQCEVKFLERHNDNLAIPDEHLPRVIRILEEQLTVASGLLEDVGTVYFKTPTCYPDREIQIREDINDAAGVMSWFVQLFDRMADLWPELANAYSTVWLASDRFFFRKLKLYALSKNCVFGADKVTSVLLSFDQETFWDIHVVRELLFLLVDRWQELSVQDQEHLTDRIMAGPSQPSHWSDEEFPGIRDEIAARYARYLELQGCTLGADRTERLAKMMQGISGWSDGWARSTVTERGSNVSFVGTDETPDAIMDIPVNEIIAKAKNNLERDFGSFTEKRPFTGLVKTNPRKALSALTVAGRTGDYPEAFWSALINELPQDVTPRLRTTFLHRLAYLPHATIVELRHTLGRWLEQNLTSVLEFNVDLGWRVFDHIVDGFISGGAEAADSGLGEVYHGGKVIERSRRTHDHAINGPFGMCANALFHSVPGKKQEVGSVVPTHIKSRVERLFAAPGEGSDHAVSIATSKLNRLMYIDPDWTRERLIPLLAFDHPASEPAWNGFLHSGCVPGPQLAEAIKPLLLQLFPWVEGFYWYHDLSKVAAQWLGFMRIFRPGEAGGLTTSEMRSVLRAMSDGTRNDLIFWLGRVGQENENGWAELVIPFIVSVWPREQRFRTSASIRAWIGLLDDTGDKFPAVLEVAKIFLVAVEMNDHPLYRFTRDVSGEEPLTTRFPEATLELLDRVTPQVLSRRPDELTSLLALIAETAPALTSDRRYLRLVDLVERS